MWNSRSTAFSPLDVVWAFTMTWQLCQFASMNQREIINQLCAVCHLFGSREWCLATSGNFSTRLPERQFLITQSGRDKAALVPEDLMCCDLDGIAIDATQTASAETPLHACLYGLDEDIGAVLHTHSVASTVLSRAAGSRIEITGFEMQKALHGFDSHEQIVSVPVFDNSQNMEALAGLVAAAWQEGVFTAPGFLIRGHGLYAWGRDVSDAMRHVEGFEFLFECLLQEGVRS